MSMNLCYNSRLYRDSSQTNVSDLVLLEHFTKRPVVGQELQNNLYVI